MDSHVWYLNKSSRLQNIQQRPSDRQKICDVDDGQGKKTDRGELDNNKMNDRLQVFGFARQHLH